RTVVPELDERWETVIRRCLEREPRRRFTRVNEVSQALAGRFAKSTTSLSPTSTHSLPFERDSFLGRDSELAALAQAIADGARLVTLLGAGGMGKTRLAVHYGWRELAKWPGGIWFCDLTEARDENGII